MSTIRPFGSAILTGGGGGGVVSMVRTSNGSGVRAGTTIGSGVRHGICASIVILGTFSTGGLGGVIFAGMDVLTTIFCSNDSISFAGRATVATVGAIFGP